MVGERGIWLAVIVLERRDSFPIDFSTKYPPLTVIFRDNQDIFHLHSHSSAVLVVDQAVREHFGYRIQSLSSPYPSSINPLRAWHFSKYSLIA